MEQLSPIPPKAMMKARRSQKRAILASLKWGEGWSRCSIYFVQDCSHIIKGHNNACSTTQKSHTFLLVITREREVKVVLETAGGDETVDNEASRHDRRYTWKEIELAQNRRR